MKKIPNINEIDLSSIPDQEIGKFAIEQLLQGFSEIPEEKRAVVLKEKQENREAFVILLKGSIFHDSALLARKGGNADIIDFERTTNAVADLILEVLGEALSIQPKTNNEIWEQLMLGVLPTLNDVIQLSASISDNDRYKNFVEKLRFAHEVELAKGSVDNNHFGYLLEREGWPNNRETLEKVLGLSS